MRSQHKSHGTRHDLVEELIGDEAENDPTHKPAGKFEILNDIGILPDTSAFISMLTMGSSCGSGAKPQ